MLSSQARTIGLQNTADYPCQGEWVRVAACHHALYGQVVRVLHREWHDDTVQLLVEGPDAKRCRLPLTWTDADLDRRCRRGLSTHLAVRSWRPARARAVGAVLPLIRTPAGLPCQPATRRRRGAASRSKRTIR